MKLALGLSVLMASASHISAMSFLWSEGAPGQGDLSDNYLMPNTFTVAPGSNFLSAEVNSNPDNSPNADFFSLIVPSGQQITSIYLLNYSFGGASGNKTFIGYQDGNTLLQPPETFTAATSENIANLLFGNSEVVPNPSDYLFDSRSRNLLEFFSEGSFSSTPPLTAGTYAFWLRETEPKIARFTFDFFVTPVPEPSSSLLSLTAMCALFLRRQRTI